MMSAQLLLLFITLNIYMPLAIAGFIAVASNKLSRRIIEALAVACGCIMLVSTIFYCLSESGGGEIPFPLFPLPVQASTDWLSKLFNLIVSLVGFAVLLFSLSYMEGDPHYARYYSLVLMFLAFMQGLVTSADFLALYLFWEGVGLCSFLLIGHYETGRAVRAALKAFITTRFGDALLLSGIALLASTTGSTAFSSFANLASKNSYVAYIVALLMLGGAVAKSAQLPLHVWLPDAMEGPTTVSALIHAATMVKAGVYLVMRLALLAVGVGALQAWYTVLTIVGLATTLYASLAATAQTDAKRLLAYSTISHLGYMFFVTGLALSTTEALEAASLHVASHAVFKALLFLTIGVVIHEFSKTPGDVTARDLRVIRGSIPLKSLPAVALFAGTLSMIGLPPFSGGFSKEAILEILIEKGDVILLTLFTAASIATVFYSLKLLYYLVFAPSEHKIKHVPKPMASSLALLTIFTILIMYIPPLKPSMFLRHLSLNSSMVSAICITVGLLAAILAYAKGVRVPQGIWTCLNQGLYIDKLYVDIILPAARWILSTVSCGVAIGGEKLVEFVIRCAHRLVCGLSRFVTGRPSDYYIVYVLGLLALIIVLLAGVIMP